MSSCKIEKEDSAALIKRLSIALINTINQRDFDFTSPAAQEVVEHISTYWVGALDTQPAQVTWEEQKASWKARAIEHPDVIFSIRDTSAEVDENKGVATVFMEMEVSGLGDLTLIAMNQSKWRRVDGHWACHHTLGMRGSPMNTGLP